NLISDQASQVIVVLRGITTGSPDSNTVGVYIDDTPFGNSTAFGFGALTTPDLDPGLLQRIEVLRGPQGTLFGASSMGGLIRYITLQPSLTQFGGRAEVDGSAVDGGSQGYGVHAMVGGPLMKDTLGFSLSGFYRVDPGYIDNPYLGLKNVNETHVDGGRLAFLWMPTSKLSVEVSSLIHDSYSIGSSDEDVSADLTPLYGELKQLRYVEEPFRVRDRLYNATVDYDLGWAKLTSITSYQTTADLYQVDQTPTFSALFESILPGVTNLGLRGRALINRDKVTEELRIASPSSKRLEWQGGVFFTRENSDIVLGISPFNSVTGQPMPLGVNLYLADTRAPYTEYAAFGDVTYHFTPKFDIIAGIRYAHNEVKYNQLGTGLLFGGTSVSVGRSTDHSVTFLFSPKYQINADNMVYVRIASGYRPGGPNSVSFGTPATKPFQPDTLTNYEIGYKAALLQHRMTLELSAFDIEWKNIQVTENLSGGGAIGNGGGARSAGFEAAGAWMPVHGLNLAANLAYTHAYLTIDAPGIGGNAGDELPDTPRFSANLSGDYDFPITDTVGGFVGASFRYQGDRRTLFVAGTPPGLGRPVMPAYETVDLRAGINRGGLEVEAYVKNLNNSHGLNTVTSLNFDGFSPPLTSAVIQPRTFGISVSDRF
ncbi:MAG: TonB-dependent receptor, partial [Caulobacteraceae bacterium]